jgi:hypothetical protein
MATRNILADLIASFTFKQTLGDGVPIRKSSSRHNAITTSQLVMRGRHGSNSASY